MHEGKNGNCHKKKETAKKILVPNSWSVRKAAVVFSVSESSIQRDF